jgi:hypothetical protein
MTKNKKENQRKEMSMKNTQSLLHFWHAHKGIVLMLVLTMLLVGCGQTQTEQEVGQGTGEPDVSMEGTSDPDVSEEAEDVAQEVEELAGASGEEIEGEVEEAGTAAAQAGEEVAEEAGEAEEELEQGAAQAGTAAAQAGEEVAEEAGEAEEELEQGAAQAGTAAAQAGEEVAEEAGEAEEELEQGAAQAGTAAAQAGEEIEEEAAGILPQELQDVEGVTISKLDDNLDDYIGQTVGVRGDIVETIGTNSFQLSDPSVLGGDEILVVGPDLDTNAINTGNTVEVSGTAYRFNLSQIEEEAGIDLQDDLFADWDNDNAVLVAQEILNIADVDGS